MKYSKSVHSPLHILVLAAGLGKRMHSRKPKVLHEVLFRPMIHYVLDLASELPFESLSLVVGFGAENVREACKDFSKINFIVQSEPLGTAHAVLQAKESLSAQTGDLLILSGDVILLRPETLTQLIKVHRDLGSAGSLITANLSTPTGYGRILRDGSGRVIGIREEKDCTVHERKVCEVNAGIYCFKIPELFTGLSEVQDTNRNKEFYLTDIVEILVRDGKTVCSVTADDPVEILGINDRHMLWRVESILQRRTNQTLLEKGVMVREIHTTYIDPSSALEPDVEIEGGCTIVRSSLKAGVKVEAFSRVVDSTIGQDTLIKQGSYIERSSVGDRCVVGPYARLRPGSQLSESVKIGNFVEIKKSRIGMGTKASHLSYIGDAEIGERVNLGCGFITCNFDGMDKYETIIEDGVFVGSDSQTVAPIRIGKGSYVASGTTLTESVPEDSLVISRGKQVTKLGYAKKYRQKERG